MLLRFQHLNALLQTLVLRPQVMQQLLHFFGLFFLAHDLAFLGFDLVVFDREGLKGTAYFSFKFTKLGSQFRRTHNQLFIHGSASNTPSLL